MAEAPSIRQSRFVNQLVIDRSTTEIVGRVEQVWMDPAVHRVLGFVCKQGLWGTRRDVFALPQIHMLGEDSIVLASSPTRAALEQVRQLESLINLEVWSEAGERVGKVVDCEFNLKTGKVIRYLMTLEGFHSFTSGLYQIFPTQIISYGDQRVLICNAATDNLELFQPGLEQRLIHASEHLSEHLKEDYTEWSQKARQMAEQAKGRLRGWTEQATQRVRELAEQTNEWTEDWKDIVEVPSRRPGQDGSQDRMSSNRAEPDLEPLDDNWDDWDENVRSHPTPPISQSGDVTDTSRTNTRTNTSRAVNYADDYPYDVPPANPSPDPSSTASLFDHVMDHNPSFNRWMDNQNASVGKDENDQVTEAGPSGGAEPLNLKDKASEQIEDDDEPWI
ncbi:MAG: PRC-barrel domain-containing protein [Thainema sp.]